MIDSFAQEHIPDDVKHLTAPEFEPFRFLSITGLGRCIAGMNNIAIGKFKKGEELIREGAKMGDPYSIFALYKMYAAQNSFGIEPDKNTAWYYLICAVFSFFSSLFYEEAPLEILNTYVDTFDNENFENSIDIIANGVEDDCTPFQEHKELMLFVFTYLMQSDQDIQKQSIIEYFKETKAELPKELVLIKLFMLYNEDLTEALTIVKSEKFREYVTQNVKEYITFYNQSGTVGISGTSVAVYNSILFNLFYLICLGKELTDENSIEIEDLVMELYQFCCVSGCKDFSKLAGVHAGSLSQLTKLDVILDGILIYLYSKGCYLNTNREKTLDYLQPYTNSPYEGIEDSELVSLRDYLVYVRGYKFYKDIKYDEEAKKMLKNISDVYTEERILEMGEAAMPIDYYIAGYIQEEHLGDAEKANKLYLEGTKVSNQVNDYGLMVGFVAFKRKCQKRAGKQTSKQI